MKSEALCDHCKTLCLESYPIIYLVDKHHNLFHLSLYVLEILQNKIQLHFYMHAETSFFFYPRYILTATIYKSYEVLFMACHEVLTPPPPETKIALPKKVNPQS